MSKINFPPTSPLRDPPGWCSLRQAFVWYATTLIGSRFPLFPRGEMERRLERALSGYAQLDSEGKVISSDDELAQVYYFPVALSFSSAVRSGRLKSAYAKKGGGKPIPMDLDWWFSDDPMVRYRTWGVDPETPYSTGPDQPCWVFVDVDDLNNVLGDSRKWRASLPEFSEVSDRANRDERTDCVADHLAVSLAQIADTGTWFTCPWLPDYERNQLPHAANDRQPPLTVVGVLAHLDSIGMIDEALQRADLSPPPAPADLEALEIPLGNKEANDAPQRKAPRYQFQSQDSARLRAMRKYIKEAEERGFLNRSGPNYVAQDKQHRDYYVRFCRNHTPRPLPHFGKSQFKLWLKRYIDGDWPIE